jgi:hypothetical protein
VIYFYCQDLEKEVILRKSINPDSPHMKTTLPLIAATYCGLCAVGSAFTLDFLAVPTGTMVPPALTINVAGYGDVRFESIGSSTVIVDNRFEKGGSVLTSSPSLNFDSGESVTITFLGLEPTNVEFDWVGVNAGEFFTVAQGLSASEFIVNLNGAALNPANNGAGLYRIGFSQVPEPSASLLGCLGATLLVLRRKR